MLHRFLLICFLGIIIFRADARNIYITTRGVDVTNVSIILHGTDSLIEKKLVSAQQLVKFDLKNFSKPYLVDIIYEYMGQSKIIKQKQTIVVNQQDVFLSVNPEFLHHADSVIYQLDEVENNALKLFRRELQLRYKSMQTLQQFVFNYAHHEEQLFTIAVAKYRHDIHTFNQWVENFSRQYNNAFVSHVFGLYRLPEVDYNCDSDERLDRMLATFMDNHSMVDADIYHFREDVKSYMDNYMFLLIKKMTEINASHETKEKSFSEIANKAISKVRKYNPSLFTYIVDYFYIGFDNAGYRNSIPELARFVDDTLYHGDFKEAVLRLHTQSQMVSIGQKCPEIMFENGETLHNLQIENRYKLLVFWSADCDHCIKSMESIQHFVLQESPSISIVAMSLDETETEIEKWKVRKQAYDFIDFHFRGEAGVNSKAAKLYGIIATPTMVLIDQKSNMICAIPKDIHSLKSFLDKHKEH